MIKFQKAITLLLLAALSVPQAIAYEFPGKGDQKVWQQACELSNQSGQLFQSGQVDQAFQGFSKAIELYPYDAVLFYNLGLAHQKYAYVIGNTDGMKIQLQQAESNFAKAANLKADVPDVWIHMANVQSELGKYPESLGSLESALKLPALTPSDKQNTLLAMEQVKAKMAPIASSPPEPEQPTTAAEPDVQPGFQLPTPTGAGSTLAPTPFTGYTVFRDPDQNSFTVEVPSGWNVQGGMVRPRPIDARPWVKVTSPDGLITAFIGDGKIPGYTMPTSTMSTLGFRPGRWYQGSLIASYIPARSFIEKYARANMKTLFNNVQVVDEHDHPDVARAYNGTVGVSRSEAASIKLTANYKDIPAVAYYLGATKATVGYGAGMWWVSMIAGEVSPADRDAAGLSVILHMLQTFRINPEWSGNAIATAGEVSRQYTQASQQASQAISNRYWSQQAANDRLHQAYWNRQAVQGKAADNFSNAMRGVENVQDPYDGQKYQVQSGPQYHWIDNSGNVTGTDHSAPGPDWRQLNPVK